MTATISALVVLASLTLVLLVGPRWVLSRAGGGAASERVPVDVVAGSVLVMVTAEVLVVLRLFEWLGLVVAATAMAAVSRWQRARRLEGPGVVEVMADQARAALYLLEAASEAGNERVKGAVRRWWGEVLRPGLRLGPKVRPPAGETAWRMSLFVVLGGSLVAGSAYALRHMALVPSGNYRQLTAMGELGLGRMFPYGAEPIGVRALLATAAELTPASYEDVVRFAGPLLATAAIGMVCVLVLRATGRRDAALVAAAAAALAGFARGSAGIEAMVAAGQAEALALVIALGGVGVAMQFAASADAGSVRHIALAALGVVLVHPPGLVVLAPAVVAAGAAVSVRRRRIVPLLQCLLAGAIGTAAGFAPVVLARAAGAAPATALEGVVPAGAGLDRLAAASLAGAVLAVLLAGKAVRARRPEAVPGVVLAVTVLAWLGLAAATHGRAVPLVLLPIGIGLGVARLRRRALVPVSLLVLAGILAPGFPPRLPDLRWAATEHDAAARALSSRLAGVTDMSYTVVGSDLSLSRVVGRTWRAELSEFTSRLTLEQAADPGFVLPVASDHLLLVAETVPPGAGQQGGGPGSEARRAEAETRAAVARRADEWMSVYARYHAGVSVAYEDAHVRVWSVHQTGNPALAERFRLAFR
jgi:hypothetical protein